MIVETDLSWLEMQDHPGWIIEANQHTLIVANSKFLELTGHTMDETTGKRLEFLMQNDHILTKDGRWIRGQVVSGVLPSLKEGCKWGFFIASEPTGQRTMHERLMAVEKASELKTILVKTAAAVNRILMSGKSWKMTMQAVVTSLKISFPAYGFIYMEANGPDGRFVISSFPDGIDGLDEEVCNSVMRQAGEHEGRKFFELPGKLIKLSVPTVWVLPIDQSSVSGSFLLITGLSASTWDSPDVDSFLDAKKLALIMAKERIVGSIMLEKLHQQYRSVISNVPGITYRCLPDENWTMLFISQEVERLTGYGADDFIGNSVRSFASIIIENENPNTVQDIALAIKTNGKFMLRYRIKTADGRILWVEDRGLGIYGDNGQLQYIDGLILDVTPRYLYAEELRKITWMQSHLVRAPLAKILSLAELLALDADSEELSLEVMIDGIRNAAIELDQIIHQVVQQSESLSKK